MKIALGLASFSTSLFLFFDVVGMNKFDNIPLTIAALIASILLSIIAFVLMTEKPAEVATTIEEPTPEQLYTKCCYCPHYAACTKTLEEVIKC